MHEARSGTHPFPRPWLIPRLTCERAPGAAMISARACPGQPLLHKHGPVQPCAVVVGGPWRLVPGPLRISGAIAHPCRCHVRITSMPTRYCGNCYFGDARPICRTGSFNDFRRSNKAFVMEFHNKFRLGRVLFPAHFVLTDLYFPWTG